MAMESNSPVTYENNSLSTYFSALEEMKQNGEFCDVAFKVRDKLLPAHRNIISAAIPYFRLMFRSDPLITGTSEAIVVNELDDDTLETFINFAYGKKIIITEENVYNLLLGAEVLKIDEILQVCREFLEKKLSPDNVFRIRVFGQTSNHSSLVEICDRYILENFAICSQCEEFLDLPLTVVREMIGGDDLNVESEEQLFEVLIKWVKKSPAKRQAALPVLLKDVRLTLLSPGYLVQRVATEELVKKIPACRELIEQAKTYHLLPEKESSDCSFCTLPRCYKGNNRSLEDEILQGIYVISPNIYPSVEIYDLAKRRWINLPFQNKRIQNYSGNYCSISHISQLRSLVVENDKIYMFRDDYLDVLDLKARTWETVKEIREDSSGVVSCRSKIYFCGDSRVHCYSIKLFDPINYSLTVIARASFSLGDPGLACLNDQIYVIGGTIYSGENKEVCRNTNDVVAYNTCAKIWTRLTPMLTKRSCPGCSVLNEKIYVCGGFQGTVPRLFLYLTTAEVYSLPTRQWVSIAPMFSAGVVLASVSYRGKLHVFQSSNALLTVDIFNPEKAEFECYDVLTKPTTCTKETKAVAVFRN